MDPKQQDEFYKEMGSKVHDDPGRFTAIAELCRGEVLDIGCGAGDLSHYYNGHYYGIDQSRVAIDIANSMRGAFAEFAVLNCWDFLNYCLKDYETVVMAEFLEHIKDWDIFIEKLIAELKSNARLVISVPNGTRVPDKDHVNIFTVPQLRKYFSQYGRVKFYPWEGFKGRILMTVDLGEKNPFKIALGMFCKNEELGIEPAVLSCINFVDEIVIMVDDSSTDETLAMAKRYADTVKTFKWEDSFCKCRNLVQENVKSEWVLYLDGHEFVKAAPDIAEKLRFDGDGLMIKIRLEDGFTFDFPRIIKRGILWDRDVHNNAQCKKVAPYSDFIIQHDRLHYQAKASAKQRAEQRKKMIESTMLKEMKKDRSNPRPYFYLGETYFGRSKYRKAIKMWKKYLRRGKNKNERWLVCFNIAIAYSFLLFVPFGLRWLNKAEKEFPGRWEIRKARGLFYFCLHDFKAASVEFANSLSETEGHFTYSPMEFDLSDTWEKIGTCLRRTGDLHGAMVAWKRSLKFSKKQEQTENLKQRVKILKEFIRAVSFTGPIDEKK